MNSNYVAEIQSTSIPDEQLVSVDIYVFEYKLLVWDTCSLSGRHVSWCKRGIKEVKLGIALSLCGTLFQAASHIGYTYEKAPLAEFKLALKIYCCVDIA